MIFLFFLIALQTDPKHNIKSLIQKLHSLNINCSTFYDLFNLRENASQREVTKRFRLLKKKKNPFKNITNQEFDDILEKGYSVLKNFKNEYDEILSNKFVYFEENISKAPSKFILILGTILFILFIDFAIFGYKYLVYIENVDKKKSNKAPRMYLMRLLRK